MKRLLVIICILLVNNVFAQKQKVDLIVYNAKVYTVDPKFTIASAIAVRGDKIEAVGSSTALLNKYTATKAVDAKGKYVYPGFIDAHAHFFRYSLGLQTLDLVGTESWEEILSRLQEFAKKNPEGWLVGRGWDQNDWPVKMVASKESGHSSPGGAQNEVAVKEFPNKEKLDLLFPDRPVVLTRVDGHAAIANQKALDLAGVKVGQRLTGGTIETKDGKLTGILVDNATALVYSKIPSPTGIQTAAALAKGQANCFATGLTTVDDCGLLYSEVLFMDSLQKAGQLKMRVYAMLSDTKENYDYLFAHGKIKTPYMNVRSFKVYADGALGSRGAALLQPYTDKHDWYGFLLSSQQHFDSVANIISQHGFQMCTHAIGDSGNRAILNIYAKYLKGKNDQRWRIEHAQVINKNDFDLFARYSIIPSVQPTHATSDMYWAEERLGTERVKGAYAFKQLLKQNKWIPLGTDFPVEDISPFKTFHSAVFRTDAKEYPKGGYQAENALTRQEALRGMTIWAAKSNFEETEKGSLENGKLADFIILDEDLMTITAAEVLTTKVIATYVGGEKVYDKK